MDIIEFAENCLKLELADYQKEILLAYYNRDPNNNFIYVPIRSGKTLVAKIITEYERAVYDTQHID